MSKELEALKRIKKLLEDKYGLLIYLDDLDIIKKALKRLENYEQNEDFNKDVLNYAFLNEKDKINKLKALDIIIKHTYSGGWSGDYTTEYWKMNKKEIKVIEKLFRGVACHPLSEKHY